ncbi:MAG TPA: hypothetical protein EYQ50_06780 [Verrucomicrobiales bacterium]|nr:hypothetical protein [Verrucomicrobiales bacterium]
MHTKLRILACIGALGHLASGLFLSYPFTPKQAWSLVLLIFMILACAALVFFFARGSLSSILHHRDLLVPVGINFLFEEVMRLLTAASVIGSLWEESASFTLFGMAYTFELQSIMYSLFNAVWVGWVVALLLQVDREKTIDLYQPFQSIKHWGCRVLVARCLGVVSIYAFITVLLAFMMALLGLGWIGGALAAILIFPLLILFNIIGFFAIPAVIERPQSFLKALPAGLVFGLRSWRRIIIPILAFGLLVGNVPRVNFSLRSNHKSFNVNFNLYWLADFPRACVWEESVSKKTGVEKLPLTNHILGLLLLGVSIVMTLDIYRRVELHQWLEGSHSVNNGRDPPETEQFQPPIADLE